MYPRNATSPPEYCLGQVVQISDGEVQTSGVDVYFKPSGSDEVLGTGSLVFGALSGCAYYTPSQAETDYASFTAVAFKNGCIAASLTIVPSATPTPGTVNVDKIKSRDVTDVGGGNTVALSTTLPPTATQNANAVAAQTSFAAFLSAWAAMAPGNVFTALTLANTPTGGMPPTVDGISLEDVLQIILASSINKTDVNQATNTVVLYARDGVTPIATLTYNPSVPGEITGSELGSGQ